MEKYFIVKTKDLKYTTFSLKNDTGELKSKINLENTVLDSNPEAADKIPGILSLMAPPGSYIEVI